MSFSAVRNVGTETPAFEAWRNSRAVARSLRTPNGFGTHWRVLMLLVAGTAFGSGDAVIAQQPGQLVPPIASAEALAFEVASVKLAAPADRTQGTLPVISRGRFEFGNVTLRTLMYYAYGTGLSTAMRVSGGPAWLKVMIRRYRCATFSNP